MIRQLKKGGLSALALLSLLSCQTNIPKDVVDFMAGFNAVTALESVESLSATYEETYSQKGTGSLLGFHAQTVRLVNQDEAYSLTVQDDYTGELRVTDEATGWVLSSKTYSVGLADGKSYQGTTTLKGKDANGNPVEKTTVTPLDPRDAKSQVQYQIIGDDTTFQGGVYYGDWLRTQSRLFSSFMTVSPDKESMRFKTPAIATDTTTGNYYTLDLTVTAAGLLTTRSSTSVDMVNKTVTNSKKTVDYVYQKA